MKLLVVNNMASGYREAAIYDFLRAFTQDGDEVVMRSTDGTTDLVTFLDDVTNFDAVVASGGDGTVTAVCDAMRNSGVPLLVFPAGTANLLALNLALPGEPYALAKLVREGRTLDFDLGRITTDQGVRGFGIMAGAGYDAAIMRDAQSAKRILGPVAYFQAAVFNLKPQTAHFTVELDDRTIEADGMCVLVANFDSIQFDIDLAVKNRPRDGYLDVIILKTKDAFGLLPFIGAALAGKSDELLERSDTIEVHRTRRVRVDADPPMQMQFDGEVSDATTPFTAEVLPGAIRFFMSDEGYKRFVEPE